MLKSSVCARTYTTKQQRREYRQQQQQNTYNKQRTAAQDLCIGGNSLALALWREDCTTQQSRCLCPGPGCTASLQLHTVFRLFRTRFELYAASKSGSCDVSRQFRVYRTTVNRRADGVRAHMSRCVRLNPAPGPLIQWHDNSGRMGSTLSVIP